MPRTPTSDVNANLAVDLFDTIMANHNRGLQQCWLTIAQLLFTCQVWGNGVWQDLDGMPIGAPVLMERNNYKRNRNNELNRSMVDAVKIGDYVARQLGINRQSLCAQLGQFFRHPRISHLQPNNPRGHAFRSLVAHVLATYGDRKLLVVEEEDARAMLPGQPLPSRSQHPSVDIAVYRGNLIVAIVSTRWTYRHDRVDMLDEAQSYVPPARRINPNCRFFGVTAEIGRARLAKVIDQSEPVNPRALVSSLVHLHSPLPGPVIGRNGGLAKLMDLEEFVNDSHNWT